MLKNKPNLNYLMLISGLVSLSGILRVPAANMNIRNIGIIGYAITAPVAITILALYYQQIYQKNNEKE